MEINIPDNSVLHYVLISALVLFIAFLITRILRIFLTRFLKTASALINVDHTKYNFIKNAVSFVVFLGAFIVIFYMVPGLRDYGVTLFAGAGVLAAIVGFASQSAFSNIIGGIFLVIFKPFRVDDLISVGTNTGRVEDITLRHTVIRNFENKRIVIPNAIISNETIINSTIVEEKICQFYEIGISYDSDADLALEIIREEAEKHPNCIDNRKEEDIEKNEPIVAVRVIGFGDSSVNLRAWIWSNSPTEAFLLKCDLNRSVKKRFDQEGIEIPFPYRTLVFKQNPPENAITQDSKNIS